MKATRLPSGSWRVKVFSHYEFKDGRKVPRYESFTSKDKTKHGKIEAERMALKWRYERTERSQNESIYNCVEDYILYRNGVISPSTATAYYSYLNIHIQSIGALSIRSLDNDKVQAWVSKMASELSPKTVHNVVGLLQSAINAKIGREIPLTLPKKVDADIYVPTDEELKKLLDHVKGKEIEIAIMLAAFCSLRRSEICALEYSDFKDGMVIINKAKVKRRDKTWEIKTPKTPESIRSVPLPPFMWEMVKDRKGLVVTCSPDNLSDRFERAVRFSHLPHFTLHSLRHYYASMAHYLGIPDAYILSNGGWKTDSVMKKIYREALQDKKKEQNDKIAEYAKKLLK